MYGWRGMHLACFNCHVEVIRINGRVEAGTVVTGRVDQGTVKTGDDLEVVGIVATQKTICTGDEEDSDWTR